MSKKPRTRPWTQEEREITTALYEEKKMYQEISTELRAKGYTRSAEAIRKFIKRIAKRSNYVAPDKSEHHVDLTMGPDHSQALIQIEDKRQHLFNIVTERYEKVGNPSGKLYKVVSISDLHIPWVNDSVVSDMISNHSDAEVLVVNGDILDQYSVSRWPKTKGILLRHEYEIAIDYLKQFSKIFKKVILTRGNHDDRLESYFANNLDPGVCFLTHPDILERMANGYAFNQHGVLEKIYDFSNVHYAGGISAWYAKVGNCIFAHPKGGSKIPMRTSVNVANYFFEKEDFDTIVCSHTHKIGKVVWKGKLLIEQGCACVPMDYEADAKMQYSQQAFGYAVVYMNNKGEVHFNKSVPVFHGTATAVDTDIRISVGNR
jgi:predicted phosphodiesterase